MKTMRLVAILAFVAVLSGCSGLQTKITFGKSVYGDSSAKIAGEVRASLKDVQQFRSLLESLEYRITQKAQ